MKTSQTFADLPTLAGHLRGKLESKKYILLYAYNGIGKTRLSMAFKDIGKRVVTSPLTTESGDALVTENGDAIVGDVVQRDTLYFNAFTEDLFHWENDMEGDSDRWLTFNARSRFFSGLDEFEMDNRIRPLLHRYADFDFRIDTQKQAVHFSRTINGRILDNIKVSRGEENLFIWCFFLAIVQLAMDPDIEAYRWVKYLYIDDPISSLDEHNAISVATHLAQLLKQDNKLKTVISTHHTLFYNVLSNEMKKEKILKYFVSRPASSSNYTLQVQQSDTPVFYHVAALTELCQAEKKDCLFTHHFNMLRTILEKTASFHGHKHFSVCIEQQDDNSDGILHARLLNILSHGNYSLFEPYQMLEENKKHFRNILDVFLKNYPFTLNLFPQAPEPEDTP
ncbi:MAG: AAA family ATPase [Nitrospirae bacterium]|nr:AAA family ATPase [Magnetococcales bacterium]HAT48785.1 anticodon nuclease [Alphaproteobacteria bacterium]